MKIRNTPQKFDTSFKKLILDKKRFICSTPLNCNTADVWRIRSPSLTANIWKKVTANIWRKWRHSLNVNCISKVPLLSDFNPQYLNCWWKLCTQNKQKSLSTNWCSIVFSMVFLSLSFSSKRQTPTLLQLKVFITVINLEKLLLLHLFLTYITHVRTSLKHIPSPWPPHILSDLLSL